MQLLFVDESGTPPPIANIKDSPFFVLGGVIIPEEHWHKVKHDLDALKLKFSIQGEIKWRYFYNRPQNTKAKDHPLSHLPYSQIEEVRTKIFSIITKYKSIKTICVIVDANKAYSLDYINTSDDLYWYAYKQLTERFQYYLQDISRISGQKINGIIVCDHRSPNDDKRLQALHAKLLLGYLGAQSNYNHLIEGLFIAPSHLSTGIQLADLVAGAVLRKTKGDERFFAQISGTLRKSESGEVKGYGLVYFPKT